jgi:hypothetical protein
MNEKQFEEAVRALMASDKGPPAKDKREEPRDTRSSAALKPTVSKRKMAISLSLFLKQQRPFLALRKHVDGKQA